MNNVEKYCRAEQATVRIACRITKATHTHAHAISNTHCFPTAPMFARTRLSVAFVPILPVVLITFSSCSVICQFVA